LAVSGIRPRPPTQTTNVTSSETKDIIQMHNHASFKGGSIMNKFTAVFERDGDWWIGYVHWSSRQTGN